MKSSPPPLPRRTISRAIARNAVLANQFATPGLGSLIARRWVAGIGQLLLAVTGFCLVVWWGGAVFIQYYMLATDFNAQPRPVSGWIGGTGAVIFFISWLWAWVTSVSLLRQARREAQAELQQPLT